MQSNYGSSASTAYFIGAADPMSPGRPNDGQGTCRLFVATVLLYVLYLAATQPHFLLGGEMWAEMATNYFANGASGSVVQKLFATDAGYVPLPQRLLAFIGNGLRLPAANIAYYYTWIAVLLTGMMVASFCLAPFRRLVASDALRFFTAIAVLWIADFESRTFINFTYFCAFFAAIHVALALSDRNGDIPRFGWLIPFLVISKPAVLAVVPALVITAFLRRGRIRLIAIVAVLLCFAQMVQMVLSQSAGTFSPMAHYTLWQKAGAAISYFFGYTAILTLGWKGTLLRHHAVLVGVVLAMLALGYAWRRRGRINPLLPVGLSLVFFNMLLNAFALSDMWNTDLARLDSPSIYRHVIIAYFGAVLAVTGLVSGAPPRDDHDGSLQRPRLLRAAPLVFLVWFVGVGWFSYARHLNQAPDFPAFGNSQWQQISQTIDRAPSACVPIDPLGWFYGRNCRLLSSGITPNGLQFQATLQEGAPRSVPLPLFESGANAQAVLSVAVPVQLLRPGAQNVAVEVLIRMRDGQTRTLLGEFHAGTFGAGLVQMNSSGPIPAAQIAEATLHSDAPLAIGYLPKGGAMAPAVMWMGQ